VAVREGLSPAIDDPFARGLLRPGKEMPMPRSTASLAVVTGCGHAGIVNTVQHARTVVRTAPVLAAIGGFHLFNAQPATIDWTADKLLGFQVAQILAAHCTGIENTFLLRQRMKRSRQDVVVASVGATFDLDRGVRTGSIAQ
jgi:7,8-dihydropterin-6-yl-methyl-4-(beta-D-ribofuranosyl)aminobenzene 5'-phosphate synthase